MIRIAAISGILLVGLLATGCATASHQTAKTDAASSLALGASVDGAAASADGLASMAWGDKWTATNLFEEAAKETGNVQNRFNLATGYQRTGREAEATVLYRALVTDGQYTNMISGGDAKDRRVPYRRFNVADESAARLAAMGHAAKIGPVEQPAAGQPVITVATGLDATPVSDESARVRDVATEVSGF